MSEIKTPKGLIARLPNQNAPDFVVAKTSIKRVELIEWLESQTDEWINLDLVKKKDDPSKIYYKVDDWKKS